jgi:two-component system, NarL family, response regulator NreC
MIKVVIADDHKMFLEGLKSLIKTVDYIEITGEASNGKEALSLIRETKPDIAILDISMPDMNGIETAREVVKQDLPTKIILLTMDKAAIVIEKAIACGVKGYLLKDNAFEELLEAIKLVQTGENYYSPGVMEEIFKKQILKKNTPSRLTPRETEVLKFIALGKTNKNIASELFISVKTVETHRSKIMQKLKIHKVADLVRYALKAGIID